MKRFVHWSILPFVLAVMIFVALNVPIPLATNSDFKVIYYTDQGLTLGVDVYDHAGKIEMINEVYGTNIDENFLPQFAYPPWYALSTFYLGLISIQQAAVLWFEINLAMLFLSVWFLTVGWKPLFRLPAFPAALFFFPVLGTLAIGQYDFPVLLGTSMLIYAIKHKQTALTVLGMVLLTFKPHLGGLILLAGLVYLWVCHTEGRLLPRSISDKMDQDPSAAKTTLPQGDTYYGKAITYTLYTGILLFLIGFLADSLWPINYLGSLFSYRDLGHITTCSECVNISVWLSRSLSGEFSLSQAGTIGSVLLILLVMLLFPIRANLIQSPSLLLTSALMVTLLASPYLYNYDFLLLLVPFSLLLNSDTERIVTALCYFGSTLALILFGRDGNNVLLVASIVTAVLLYLRIRTKVDVPASAPYNTAN